MPDSKKLTQYQSFWIVSGIFFYFSLRIPAFLFAHYFDMQQNIPVAKAIISVYNYSEIIPYLLFIKAMTCKTEE